MLQLLLLKFLRVCQAYQQIEDPLLGVLREGKVFQAAHQQRAYFSHPLRHQLFIIVIMTEKSIRKIEPTSCVYNKEQMLGKGSFGEVFLGFDQEKKNPVAVKVVSFERISSKMNSEEAVKKLTGEVVNMQLAKH